MELIDTKLKRPLDGLTVVALEHAVAAPFATRQLADLGARVIKVEKPVGGDFARNYDEAVAGLSSYHVWVNRGKESIALDLKSPQGREILERLLAAADVVVQNLGPGAAERLDVSPSQLLARYPTMVACRISGWGSDGPWAGRKAYDLLVQAEAGVVALTGSDRDVAKAGIPVADIAAGMYAFSAVLAALYQRRTSGVGDCIELSLFEALVEWLGQPMQYAEGYGEPPRRTGTAHATISPYREYICADGQPVVMAVQNAGEWRSFCVGFLEQPDLETDERFATNTLRVAHRDQVDAIVSRRFSELGSEEAIALLDHCRIANAQVNSLTDVLDHPVLAARDRWRSVRTESGEVRATLPPIQIGALESAMGAVPALGEHTESLLTKLGVSDGEIRTLLDTGVVSSARREFWTAG
ncbi:CaiB/BaiF CoA-transferase family protein [Mycolicibacterium sp. 624]|uniref:CaiB/BaiF CoA transferase family protein n=1 Tax=Mycolicibacterium sp. 624 TaxID=3156314 RepID=UPI0033970207